MENKITDINDLILFLSGTAMHPLLTNEIWQKFGYKKRPKKGNILTKLFPKYFALYNLITREILTMGLIDTLDGIKKSNKSTDIQLLISIGVIDKFLSTTKHLFDPSLFMENIFSTYTSFTKCERSKLYELFVFRAKDILNNEYFAKFLVGITALLGTPPYTGNFLIKSDYIKEIVDASPVENKLKIDMTKETYYKYGHLISEKIINT
ncbi:hypothetical protein KKA87_03390 [bacterium]|nr:hypothetical protein [bacterium]MBU1873940.1 hypothetical protein [bacterium]